MGEFVRVAITTSVIFLTVTLTVFCIDSARAAKGDYQYPASPSPDLMQALMAWAAPQLDLPVPDEMPIIVRKDHCGIQKLSQPDLPCAEEGRGSLAVYDSGIMWINNDWRADSLKDVSILLHELVHHIQHHAGVPETPCKAEALEKPAYDVQFAFLEAAGVDPYETIGINALMLLFVTNCMSQH